MTPEERGVWRVSGTNIERMAVQTDWENDEAVDFLQRRFQRIRLEDMLAKAGCVPGDEVRILGFAFPFEAAGDTTHAYVGEDEDLPAGDTDQAVEGQEE